MELYRRRECDQKQARDKAARRNAEVQSRKGGRVENEGGSRSRLANRRERERSHKLLVADSRKPMSLGFDFLESNGESSFPSQETHGEDRQGSTACRRLLASCGRMTGRGGSQLGPNKETYVGATREESKA